MWSRSHALFLNCWPLSARYWANVPGIVSGNPSLSHVNRFMHLTPQDRDKLLLHNAGFLAQKRLARGRRLNDPEAVALIATQILEFIRDGRSVAELMDWGRRFLGRRQVMPGVPQLVAEV